ncbi:MAG: ribosome recycling factor [Planctomycetaceae bacterium]|uniref:Ribosome-recycling factor n=1 Tax=Lacipirellula limnantheis TaxID=2528024 RepID=A0A517TUS3_9BACT|nr:ribosome recycling factor [Lacipirellula limnantheis]MBL9163215.1 ribosome recycling factor [Planctomycetaceae bacterium]QDT72124.1 Ribosome-recycling factor [Lacipirellula limnantheis]
MSSDEILMDAEERMEKAVSKLKSDLTGIRTGRANPGLVDSLRVEVYGSQSPIKQIASVSAPEPQQLVIRPFDPSTIKDIERAIINSDLGLAPNSDGKVIRLNIPPLSGDVRKKMIARTKDLSEEAKIAIRNVRRDGNKHADTAEKDGELSEDDCKALKDEIQELTKKYENSANDLAKTKETEVSGS